MTDRFQILLKFLERFDDEVQGRELSEPAPEAKAKLQQLARGTLPEKDQELVFAQLDQHPDWIRWLATEVKTLRATSDR
jgi:hypothetical protein